MEEKIYTPDTIPEFNSNLDDVPWLTNNKLLDNISIQTPEYSGSFDTSLITATTDNVYTLTVANPDDQIFSIWVDWQEKSFSIPNYFSSTLAYQDLESQLQSWLAAYYTIAWDSWTWFTISKENKQPIVFTSPNHIKKIQLSNWNEHVSLDIIVDWVTYSYDWVTYPTSAGVISSLFTSLWWSYLRKIPASSTLLIGLSDWTNPNVTFIEDNRYTYTFWAHYTDTASAGEFLEYMKLTADGTDYNYFTNVSGRAYDWNLMIDSLVWNTITSSYTPSGSPSTTPWVTDYRWLQVDVAERCRFTTATKDSSSTATKARLTDWTTTLEEVSFVWDIATFSTILDIWTYYVEAWSSWATYTNTNQQITTVYNYNNYVNVIWYPISTTFYVDNFVSVWTKLLLDEDYNIYDVTIDNTYWNWSYLSLRNSDYSAATLSRLNNYTDDINFPEDTSYTTLITDTNTGKIAVTTYTEISISAWLDSFNYFIPVKSNFKKITLTAVSNIWSSEWTYKQRNQSCTFKTWIVSPTTSTIDDYIFKTDANNYWKVTSVRTWWFVLNLTTNTSNKINFTCN
jgi:hypothetical protein